MAALIQFPNFLPFFSHKPISSPNPHQWPSWKTHEYKPRRNLTICASSIKRPRGGRKVKSNEELCNDIKEFVASVGLPEGHLPSLKELSQHGRNDLANIVRRRGYKLIKKLLSSSPETDIDGYIAESNVVQKHDATGDSKGEYQKSKNAIEDVPLPTEVFSTENNLVGEGVEVDSNDHNCTMETTVQTLGDRKEIEGAMLEGVSASTLLPVEEKFPGSLNVNPGHNSVLEERAAKFVQNGDLDAIEYKIYELKNESGCKESKEVGGINEEVATQSRDKRKECSKHAYDAVMRPNGSATVTKQVAPPVSMGFLPWSHNNREAQRLNGDNLREYLNSETTKRDNLIEINHLKCMLHQKELELSHLKEQIEKEKMALSYLQNKAETEIQKAQKLVSEKEAELLAAEESLSGLQEVQLEYSGDGEIVEVSGSFNGWHHRIKMDPKPSSTIEDPIELSKAKIWSTVLWLYPGIYEIKFIVDGQWKLDPERESTTNDRMCNNILRVDR